MKTLNEYMSMSYKMEIIEDQDEGGFVISYPDLPGCITCGETIESAMQNAKDAKREWIRAALEEGIEIYEPDSLENYSGQFKLRIPRSLHRSLAEHSQREGISMNQYCVYLQMQSAENRGRREGIYQGKILTQISMIQKKVKKNKNLEQIVDELEEPMEEIRPIYDQVKQHPDKTAEEIYNLINNE